MILSVEKPAHFHPSPFRRSLYAPSSRGLVIPQGALTAPSSALAKVGDGSRIAYVQGGANSLTSSFLGGQAAPFDGCKFLIFHLIFICSGFTATPRHAARARSGRAWLSFVAASLAAIRSDHVRSNGPDFCGTQNDLPGGDPPAHAAALHALNDKHLVAASTISDPMPMALSARAA